MTYEREWTMKITKHAKERSKERNGWNIKATERMSKKVLEQGIRHSQTKGRLNRWMSSLYNKHRREGADIRLYGDKAYIFANETLITVLQIPSNLTKDINNFIIREKSGNDVSES